MIDLLKQAVERAAQQPEAEQTAIAQAIIEMLDADAAWQTLLSDPHTPQALDELWAEALEDVQAGRAEETKGDGFGS